VSDAFREPRVGDDVHVVGASPAWHDYYYREAKLVAQRPILQAYISHQVWTFQRANGTIVHIEWEHGEPSEIAVEMDAGSVEMYFDINDFTNYYHPVPGERGMWMVT